MQGLPAKSGIEMANWNWKVVHRFIWERWGVSLSRSSCPNYLHRLGSAAVPDGVRRGVGLSVGIDERPPGRPRAVA